MDVRFRGLGGTSGFIRLSKSKFANLCLQVPHRADGGDVVQADVQGLHYNCHRDRNSEYRLAKLFSCCDKSSVPFTHSRVSSLFVRSWTSVSMWLNDHREG